MRRALLTLVFLAVPAQAAPQLKSRPPDRLSEAGRIEELRAKYVRVRTSEDREERLRFRIEEQRLAQFIRILDRLALAPPSEQNAMTRHGVMEKIEQEPVWKDLYDIAMYDRKRAADK